MTEIEMPDNVREMIEWLDNQPSPDKRFHEAASLLKTAMTEIVGYERTFDLCERASTALRELYAATHPDEHFLPDTTTVTVWAVEEIARLSASVARLMQQRNQPDARTTPKAPRPRATAPTKMARGR